MKNKIGSVVNYNGYDWIVIKEGDDITLMMKDCLSEDEIKELFENDDIDDNDPYYVVFNHDRTNNDWCSSHIRTVLNGKFLDKFNKSDLNLMKTNYDEDKYSNDYIRIPTIREIEKLDDDILIVEDKFYWTMSPAFFHSSYRAAYVLYVNPTGHFSYNWVTDRLGVRPVINLKAEALKKDEKTRKSNISLNSFINEIERLLADLRKVIDKLEKDNNELERLQYENQQLKEKMVNLYKEFELGNVSTATEYKMICLRDEIHKKEVDKLKQQLDLYKSVIDEIWNFIKTYPSISQSGFLTVKGIIDKANIKESE